MEVTIHGQVKILFAPGQLTTHGQVKYEFALFMEVKNEFALHMDIKKLIYPVYR